MDIFSLKLLRKIFLLNTLKLLVDGSKLKILCYQFFVLHKLNTTQYLHQYPKILFLLSTFLNESIHSNVSGSLLNIVSTLHFTV